METSLFILALSKTLPESCLQGLLVFIALKLLISVHKNSTPSLRFNLYYGASVLLFAGFLFTLFKHYGEAQNAAINSFTASNSAPANAVIPASKINIAQTVSYWTSRYAYTITGLYLMGLVFCVLRLTIGLININWFRKNEQQHESQWNNQVAALSKKFKLVKTVSVYLSHKIQVPLTIGFIKPVIVFPIALVNQLTVAQTEAILLHELAHIKRADYLLNILLSIIQSFLFFNPIVWLMSREINLYREQCCDDLVLDKTSDTLAYAHALLQIETFRNAQLSLALAANGKKYTLLNRIKRITNMEINNPSPQNKLIVLLLALTTIGLSVAWNVPAKKLIKRTTATQFKAIKTALDTNYVEQFTDVYPAANKQPKNIKPFNRKLSSQPEPITDTVIKSKNKFKIVLEDSTGNKKEYNSVEELPADAKSAFLKENQKVGQLQRLSFSDNFIDTSNYASVRKYYNSPEWKKKEEAINKMGRDVDSYYNSPEWKKKEEAINKMGRDVDNYYNSPEWKKKMADIKIQGEEMRKQFNSPEWKKQMEDIKVQGEEIKKQFNSLEWKKQMEDLRKESEKLNKQFNSKKWRQQMEKLQKNSLKYRFPEKPEAPEKPEVPEKPESPEKI